jgi:hypothetical protein
MAADFLVRSLMEFPVNEEAKAVNASISLHAVRKKGD